MSSKPMVMLPLPSAVKLPTRVNRLPTPAQSSLPVMENAYCPARLASENLGGGGDGGGPDPPPSPHATTRKLSGISARRTYRRFAFAFIGRSRSARLAHAVRSTRCVSRLPRVGILGSSVLRWLGCPSARCAPEGRCLCLWYSMLL